MFPQKTNAVYCKLTTDPPSPIPEFTNKITFTFDLTTAQQQKFFETVPRGGQLLLSFQGTLESLCNTSSGPTVNDPTLFNKISISSTCDVIRKEGKYNVGLIYEYKQIIQGEEKKKQKVICDYQPFTVGRKLPSCQVDVQLVDGIGDPGSTWEINVYNVSWGYRPYLMVSIRDNDEEIVTNKNYFPSEGNSFKKTIKGLETGIHRITVRDKESGIDYFMCGPKIFEVTNWLTPLPPSPTPPPPTLFPFSCDYCDSWNCSDPNDDCVKYGCPRCGVTPRMTMPPTKPPSTPNPPAPTLGPICDQINQADLKVKCKCCMDPKSVGCKEPPGIWTAVGCLPTDYAKIVSFFFTIGVGIAGGIAFLFFLFGAFMILTSAGNAEQIEEGRQTITSALSGLLLIIFSIFLLGVIGVNILQIPGLTNK